MEESVEDMELWDLAKHVDHMDSIQMGEQHDMGNH